MTELMKPVGGADVSLVPPAVEVETHPSVRELLTELAALEDATRAPGGTRRERRAAQARQQEILDELHRDSPGTSLAT